MFKKIRRALRNPRDLVAKYGRGTVIRAGEGMSVLREPKWPSDIVRPLVVGETVKIHEIEGDFYRIGRDEWVFKDFVYRHHVGKVSKRAQGTSSVRKPEWPSDLVRRLRAGDGVMVYEKENGFYRVGKDEWIHGDFLNFVYVAKVNAKGAGMSSVEKPEWPSGTVKPLRVGFPLVVYEHDNHFYRIGDNEWVHEDFVEIRSMVR